MTNKQMIICILYNETSLLDVAESYISYKSVDTDTDSIWEEICQIGLERTLGNDEFLLEKSETKFEEI